ncbi:MAG: hypothetical protein ACFB10_21400 [Salibacteraceae bacterium]
MEPIKGTRNKKKKNNISKAAPLTVEQVLATKGFENWTRKQAQEYIESLDRYCRLMYPLYCRLKNMNRL